MRAAQQGRVRSCAALLRCGAAVELTDHRGCNALHLATKVHNISIFFLIIFHHSQFSFL